MADRQPTGKKVCSVTTQEWKRWLDLAINASPEARKKIEGLGKAPRSPECVLRLKEALLEEWGHRPEEHELRSARLVWLPEADLPAKEKVRSPLVIVIGSVRPDGGFQDLRLKGSTGNAVVDQRCLDIASRARFRPARQGNCYKFSAAAITIHFHL